MSLRLEESPTVTALMLDPSKHTSEPLNPTHRGTKLSDLRKDAYKLSLLLYLYFLQGIPIGKHI